MNIKIVTEIPDLRYGVYHLGSSGKVVTAVFISDYAALKFGETFWPKSGFVIIDLQQNKEEIHQPKE